MAVILLTSLGERVSLAQMVDFNPDTATRLDSVPSSGTFFPIQGGIAPLPFDPMPDADLYWDGITNVFWYDTSSGSHSGGYSMDSDLFGFPLGTNSPGTYSNNFNLPIYTYAAGLQNYTNFWLSISATPTNIQTVLVTINNTLPGYYYSVLTNTNVTTTNWVVWTNVLASDTNTPCPPLTLSTNPVFFRGKIVLPSGSYITNGLVAYWKLNDASGTNAADSSGNGNPLVLTNSPYWGPGSLILNGTNQYGDAGQNTNTEIDYQSISICAWVNQTSNAFKGIVDKSYNIYGFGADGWGLWTTNDGHALFSGQSGLQLVDNGPLTITPGVWTFLTLSFHYGDGLGKDTHGYFYVNGIFNSDQNNPSIVPTKTSPYADLLVGNLQSNRANGLYCFNGLLRDVAVYNRALTDAEIHSNYLSTAYNVSLSTPDILYYKMAEYNLSNATSPTLALYDSSIHGGTTGTYHNLSETWITNNAGLSNTALHFGGPGADPYLETSNSTLFNFTTNTFTINLWVCPNSSSDHYFAQNMDAGASNGWYIYYDSTYTASFGMVSNGNVSGLTASGGSAQNSNWNMLTIVRPALTNAIFYVNGIPVTSGNIASAGSSTNSLKFAISPSGTDFYDGNIWLAQIWTNVLSQSDIGNLYQEQLLGVPWP